MTITAASPPRQDEDRQHPWVTYYIWTPAGRDQADALIRDILAPSSDRAMALGEVNRWFFLRYSDGGLHVRWRMDAPIEVAERLATQVARDSGLLLTEGDYQREPERYGGVDHLARAEQAFCTSSAIAARIVADRPTSAHRLEAAVALVIATARGLGLDPAATVSWLRSNAYSWRWHLEPSDAGRSAVLMGHAIGAGRERSETIRAHFDREPLGEWYELVRTTSNQQRDLGSPRRLGVWASQLHLLLNRIGITPDEERWVEWFVAAALEVTTPPEDYFDSSLGAPDRVYLAASRFLPADMPLQAPDDGPAPEPLFDWGPLGRRGNALQSAGLPPIHLAEALRRRASRRGPHGPLAQDQLATLLWEATTAPGGEGLTGRTYPSAGAQYAARLRLLIRSVSGIEPGVYDADIDRRMLVPIAPLPPVADVAAISMWFTDGPPGPMQVDVNTLPALIGVVLDVRTIRARYGLRALRMALLEAGHLTQNLALVAAATDLQLCPVGGLYDDLAHDVFLVDGLERFLTYVLPVGGGIEARHPLGPPTTESVARPAASPMPTGARRGHSEPTSNDGRSE